MPSVNRSIFGAMAKRKVGGSKPNPEQTARPEGMSDMESMMEKEMENPRHRSLLRKYLSGGVSTRRLLLE